MSCSCNKKNTSFSDEQKTWSTDSSLQSSPFDPFANMLDRFKESFQQKNSRAYNTQQNEWSMAYNVNPYNGVFNVGAQMPVNNGFLVTPPPAKNDYCNINNTWK